MFKNKFLPQGVGNDRSKIKKKQILSPIRRKERKVLDWNTNPPSSHLLKRASGHQNHSQTVHWCLHGPQVQSDSCGCVGGTSWWSHPAGERSPLHLGSLQMRGGIGRSPAWEWMGPLPREILLWKDKCKIIDYRCWSCSEESIGVSAILYVQQYI